MELDKYHRKLNKLFKKLETVCKKKCRAMNFDYFYFYYQAAEDVDYIQAYYDIHSDYEEVLGHEIFGLN